MNKGQKLQNKARQSYVLYTALLFNEIYLSIKFRDDISYSFIIELCPGKNSKCKSEERAITRKIDKVVFRFFSIAVLSNEIYLPTKFNVDISNSFRVMSRTKVKK
jgi:hypothetical protein